MEFSWTTFWLELGNLLVLVWILKRVLYAPVRKIIDERRQAALAQLERAREMEQAATELQRQFVEEKASWDRALDERRRAAREEARAETERMLERAREDIEHKLARSRQVLEQERGQALAALRTEALDVIVEAARCLMVRAGGERLADALWSELLDRLTHLAPDELEEAQTAAGDSKVHAELRVADAPTAEARAALEDAIGQAVVASERPDCRIVIDQRLGSGARLRINGLVLDASVDGVLSEVLRGHVKTAASNR